MDCEQYISICRAINVKFPNSLSTLADALATVTDDLDDQYQILHYKMARWYDVTKRYNELHETNTDDAKSLMTEMVIQQRSINKVREELEISYQRCTSIEKVIRAKRLLIATGIDDTTTYTVSSSSDSSIVFTTSFDEEATNSSYIHELN